MEMNLLQNATLLEDIDLSLTKHEFSSIGQGLIDKAIGDDKVNVIVAIYDLNGKALFRNDNALIFELPSVINPKFSTWEDVEHKEYYVKYLTIKDHDDQRIIKVGMILNQSLIRWKGLNKRIFIFVGIIIGIVSLISFLLTHLLFRPVKVLATQVNLMAEKIATGDYVELQSWFQKFNKSSRPNDEFSTLLRSLDRLAKKISETEQMTQRWSALMAHELKTPMTLLKLSLDELFAGADVPPSSLTNVELELKKLEDIIMGFLDWASVENDSSQPDMFAINVTERIKDFASFFRKSNPDFKINIETLGGNDLRIFCNEIHFEQLVGNILSNASKYASGEVRITISDGSLIFQDNGPGIPQKVIENFGKPFNKFKQGLAPGHGLGLAWISTISKKYDWKINISVSSGTRIEIFFR